MKKILICSFLILGCTSKNTESLLPPKEPFITASHTQDRESPVYLFVIDSCEYLGYMNESFGDYLTHKGNCRFCIERKHAQ